MKIKSGIYDIYETGSVISMNNEPIDFTLENLLYRFRFVDDATKVQNFLEAQQLTATGIELIFYNFNNSLGIGNKEPLPVGWLNNRNLYLNYRVYALQSGLGKLIHFTWYLGEVKNG